MHLVHLASRLYGTPLLVARAKLDVILSVLGPRIGLPGTDLAIPIPPPRSTAAAMLPGIAVIAVHGTLVRRSMGVEAASGLTSYGEIGASLDAALTDPQVEGILLDVDSPGGEAGGVFELAQRVRAASLVKPVWAHANDSAFSAAYAIAAAATRITLSQTAGVGSIGVIALHVDQSVKDARDGLAYTAIFAGQHKNDFSPHAPLSAEAAIALQAEVDRLYEIFVGHVAQMRGLDVDAIRGFDAGLLFGGAAVGAGLADAVTSLEQVMAEFATTLSAQRRLNAPAIKDRSPPARASPAAAIAAPVSTTQFIPITEQPMHDHDPSTPVDAATPVVETQDVGLAATPAVIRSSTDPVAAAHARSEAQAIAEVCLIAGAAHRTAEFLACGMTEAQVRRTLIEARAQQPEISSRIDPDAGTSSRPEASPIVAAVKKLVSKE